MRKIFILFLLFMSVTVSATTYYVSNSGNDNNSGLSEASTWKTLEKVNSKMNSFVSGDIIAFKGGDEFFGKLYIIKKEGITFTSYGLGKAVVKGSKNIIGWTKKSGNIWETKISGTIYSSFDNGAIMKNARIPNTGNYQVTTVSNNLRVFTCSSLIGHADLVGATVQIRTQPWFISNGVISAFNSGTGKITLESDIAGYTIGSGQDFFVVNHKNLIDKANEWAYDGSKMYIYSVSSPANISASSTDDGFIISSSDYLDIENLIVKNYGLSGIKPTTSNNLKINNCEFYDNYGYGIEVRSGINITIDNSVFARSMIRCVLLHSDGSSVKNSSFTDIGMEENISWGRVIAFAGIETGGDNVVVSNNTFNNIGYYAIGFGGLNNRIEKNFINKFCQTVEDGGAIYTFNTDYNLPGSQGTVVENNIILGNSNATGSGQTHGIYLDDRTHDVTVRDNSIQDVSIGIYMHNNKRVEVRDNKIYNTYSIGIHLKEDFKEGEMVNNIIDGNDILTLRNSTTAFPIYIRTTFADGLWDFGTYNNNNYFNPNYSALQSVVLANAKANYFTLTQWKSISGEDANSNENSSLWSGGEESKMVYNNTDVAKVITLSGVWGDLSGNQYNGSITLQPYTSEILILIEKGTGFINANAGEDIEICKGEKATLKASGGSSYTWSNEETTQSITVNPSVTTTYTVTVSDGKSTAIDDVLVTVNDVTANAGADVSIDYGDTITLTASGGDTHVWSTGETTASISVSPTATTDYTVTVKKGLCEDTDLVKVTVTTVVSQPVTANAGVDVEICNGESTILTASGGTTYSWSNGETTQSITVNPTVTKTYTVTVSDGSTTATDGVMVTVNEVSANAGEDVSIDSGDTITLTASGGDTYVWSTGETTTSISISPTVTTDYTVTAIKGLCKDTDLVKVTVNNPVPQPVTANAGSDVSICNGEATILSATGGSSYTWSNGETTQSISVIPSVTTTYTVTVSDGSSTASDDVLVTVNNVTANAGEDVSIDSGDTITLTASGGDTYVWSTGETTASISVNPTATTDYTVTAKKGLCKDTDLVKVTVNNPVPQPVTVNAGSDVSICNGEATILSATGGSSYTWSNGETTQSISVIPSVTTTYTVTVSDGSSTASDDVLVTVNEVSANAGEDVSIDSGDTITLTASGGDTYVWSTGETTASISVNPTATTDYTVTAKKGHCKDTDLVKVTVNNVAPQPVIANAGLDVSICNGESTILTASGGTTYSWSNGGTTQSITVNPTATSSYAVTVSDGKSTATDDVLVTVNDLPIADAGSDITIYKGDDTTLTASGGDSYKWNTGAISKSIRVAPDATKNYTLTVYKNGCEATDKVKVTVLETKVTNPPPAVAYAGDDISICLGESVTLTASGGDSYAWDTGDTKTNISVNPTRTTTYRLSASRGGTTDMDEIIVTVENCNLNASLPEEEIYKSIAVYPNPTNGLLNINLSNINDDLNLILLDVQGRIIYLDKLNGIPGNLSKQIDISRFSKGIYFVKLYNESENFTRKILLI